MIVLQSYGYHNYSFWGVINLLAKATFQVCMFYLATKMNNKVVGKKQLIQ